MISSSQRGRNLQKISIKSIGNLGMRGPRCAGGAPVTLAGAVPCRGERESGGACPVPGDWRRHEYTTARVSISNPPPGLPIWKIHGWSQMDDASWSQVCPRRRQELSLPKIQGMQQHHALMQNEVAALMQNEVAAVLDGVVKVGQNMPHRFSCASVND